MNAGTEHEKPLVIDLYCGLGGWSEGFLAEGYRCVGYDLEAHDYGSGGYPGELVLRDVRSIHGSEFRDAAIIVGSSPCQEFSYRAMPWSRAKALPPPYLGIELFNAQFRIQREASEAAGRHIPMVVENVRGAQKWVGRAQWHFGSYFLWGDVPALMPMTLKSEKKTDCSPMVGKLFRETGERVSRITTGHLEGVKVPGIKLSEIGFNVAAAQRYRAGIKQPGISGPRNNGKGDKWFQDGAAKHGSRSNSRKAASAMIAKIPFPLASHIARCYYPAER